MSAITAKASRKMKKYAVLTREPRCFLGSFDFSWEQRKAIDIADYSKGNGYSKGDLTDSGTPIILYGRLYTKYQFAISEVDTFAVPRNGAVYSQGNEVIVPASGETAEDIARASAVEESGVLLGGDLNILRPFDFINPLFLALAISNGEPQKELAKKAQGKSVVHIHNTDIQEVTIAYPSRTEQDRIVSVFRQLDNLITLHQRKCALLFSSFQALISMMFTTSTFSWEQRKLGDIGKARSGVGFPDADQGGLTGVPFFKVSDMNSDGNENEMTVANNYVTAEQIADHRWSPITELPAIFFAKVGAAVMLNRKRLCRFPFLLDNNTMAYSLSPTKWDADFAKALFGTVDLTSLVQVGALPSYNAGDVESMEIYLPSLLEQEQIGAYFNHLDNLITLHQRKCISFTVRAGRLISTVNKKRITSSWEQRKLGELVDRVVRKNTNNESTLPLTISAQYGLVDQITYFNNRVASRDVSNYYLVLNGEFAYNKSTSDGYPFGAVKRLDLYEKGVLSTLYIVFAPKKEQQIDSDYLTVFFDTDRWHKGVAERAAEGARNHGLLNISAEDFFDIDLSVPKDIVEQKQIGAFIRQLDNLITLHQRKPFLMKWRTSDANRNQTNRLVL